MTTPSSSTTVILFLDVDGVLNDNWHGSKDATRSLDSFEIESKRLQCLSELCQRLIEQLELDPKIVFSTTWRTQPNHFQRLLTALEETPCTSINNKNLRNFVYGGGGGGEILISNNDACKTPTLGCSGREPEGRARQINGWLTEHTSPSNRPLYLALDDLNLCFGSDGTHNASFDTLHLLHTVDETHDDENGDVLLGGDAIGLTPERIDQAIQKIQYQKEQRQQQHNGCVGGFSAEEWAMLQTSSFPLSVLSKPTCPPWIQNAAEEWLKQQNRESKKKSCIIM